jgi:zinc protease
MSLAISRRINQLATALLLGALALPATLAAQLPTGVKKGASVEGITEYYLENGLRVLIFPDASKPTATINITYLVGSRHEGYGETGMAHLLEHMVFKGSPRHPNIPQELTDHGARPNGSTWFDRTNYFETVPATDENITWALDLEADRMVNSYIAEKELKSEFSVVRNEFEAGENSPANVLVERALASAFIWHNYGKTTIGARSDIENVPIERLQAFYRKYYQPDNAVLVVAGKVDEAKVLRQIAEKYGMIPKPARSLATGNMIFPTYTEEPTQDGEREVSLRRVGDVQLAMAMYHVPAGSHADYAAVEVLVHLLGSAPSGRLYKAMVESKKATAASVFDFQLREPGVLVAQATMRKEQSLDDAKNILMQTMEGLASAPVTAEEVDRAKTFLLKNIDLALNNSGSVGLDLSEWAAMGDWRLLFVDRDRIKKVTPADVQRVAVTYLKSSNRTLGLFHPTEKPDRAVIPVVTLADVIALTKDYKGNPALAAGEVFDPSPSNIDSRTTRSTLPGGMKVTLLPKATRGNTVNAIVTLRFGDEKSLNGRSLAAQAVGPMLSRGSKNMTRQQISDAFDKIKAQVGFSSSGNALTANISTTRENLIPALRLAGEVLREPVFPQQEFDTYKASQLAGIEQNKSEPGFLGSVIMSRKLTPYPKGHPLYTGTVEEQIDEIKALTVDDVKKVYADLVGASYGDVAVVGDFSKDSVTAVVKELFGSWKSPRPFARLERKFFDVPQFNEKIETPDKANAFFFAGQNLRLRDDSKEYAALAVGGTILGGGFLNSRLATRIRQRDGLSYGVGASIGAQALDSVGSLSASAIYNPENLVRLESAFGEEIDKVLKDGFTVDEVEKAKQGWLQQQLQSRSSDAFLANTFANQTITGRTMSYNEQLEKWVAALTVGDVNATMKKYLNPARISIVKAGDFQNHPQKVLPIKPPPGGP